MPFNRSAHGATRSAHSSPTTIQRASDWSRKYCSSSPFAAVFKGMATAPILPRPQTTQKYSGQLLSMTAT